MTSPSLNKIASNVKIDNIGAFTHVAVAIYPLSNLLVIEPEQISFSDLNVTAVFGSNDLSIAAPLTYGPLRINENRDRYVRVSAPEKNFEFNDLSYAVLFAPYNEFEPEPWVRIENCIATLSLFGQNRVFARCFDRYIVEQKTYEWSQIGTESRIPIEPVRYKDLNSTKSIMESFLKRKYSRAFCLALDWYYRSLNSDDDVFAFLASWIACETIACRKSYGTFEISVIWSLHYFNGVRI